MLCSAACYDGADKCLKAAETAALPYRSPTCAPLVLAFYVSLTAFVVLAVVALLVYFFERQCDDRIPYV